MKSAGPILLAFLAGLILGYFAARAKLYRYEFTTTGPYGINKVRFDHWTGEARTWNGVSGQWQDTP